MPDRMEERLNRMISKTSGGSKGLNTKQAVEKLIDKGMPKKVAEKAAAKKAAAKKAPGKKGK